VGTATPYWRCNSRHRPQTRLAQQRHGISRADGWRARAAALVTFAPDPLHLVYELLFALTALMMVLLFVMPETVTRKAGALASLRPRVSVPRQSRAALLRIMRQHCGLGVRGFYLSLMRRGGDGPWRPRALVGASSLRRPGCPPR